MIPVLLDPWFTNHHQKCSEHSAGVSAETSECDPISPQKNKVINQRECIRKKKKKGKKENFPLLQGEYNWLHFTDEEIKALKSKETQI